MKLKFKILLCLTFMLFVIRTAYAFSDGWSIKVNSREHYNGVTLANGRIGLVSRASLFSVSEIVLNSVFDKVSEEGVSQIVRAPLFTNLRLKIDGVLLQDENVSSWSQKLNMKEATLTTTILYGETKISYTLCAMRNLPYMGLGVIEIKSKKSVEIELVNEVVFPEELQDRKTRFTVMRYGESLLPVYSSFSKSRTGKQNIATSSTFLCGKDERISITGVEGGDNKAMCFRRVLQPGENYRCALIGAVCTSRDFDDPKSESERMVIYAMQHNLADLIKGHKEEWAELWESDILVEGCLEDQLDIRLALYHLYAFQRKGSRLSIPPMGLSNAKGYNGHVFWDSELWMFPPILILNQDLARAHIDYRSDRLDKALQRASIFGFRGAMFPWESDDSGEEATPTWALTGTFEHHITADIAIAFWNYYRVTKDKEWLRNEGYKVMKEVADFWVSRVSENKDRSFSVKNVVGANEYATNVDDNAFTNGAVKIALMDAVKAARILGVEPNKKWILVSEGLRFYSMKDGTTKEHATYDGEIIKQADVNLLAYPLGLVSKKEDIIRDLNYYEPKIDKNGPAMGNCILSILYSRLGDVDKAYRLFHKSYIPNKRPPFGVLSESANSNNPYFSTAAGGLLQAVLYGFAGLDLSDEGIVRRPPALPKEWKSLTIKGIGCQKETIKIVR